MNRQNNSNQQMISHPPTITSYTIRHNTRLRFTSNAAVSQSITFQNLLDTMLFASSATAGFDVFEAVRIRRVEVWSLPILGAAATCSVEFNGASTGFIGDQRLHSDTSMGIQPAHVSAVPERQSLASNYQESSATAAFFLVCPTGSVVDVECNFISGFVENIAAQNALVTATTGAILLRGLDGLATATTKLPTVVALAAI
jgi:hypothetical protein